MDNTNGNIYIGSTCNSLSKRINDHKSAYKTYPKSKYCSSFEVLKNDNYDIILLEEYPCENVEQLRAKEREYIDKLECVNTSIPGRSKAESNKNYYENNKEKIIEKVKEWRIENHTPEKAHERYMKNIEYEKARRTLNYTCECGKIVKVCKKSRHIKTTYHISRMNT